MPKTFKHSWVNMTHKHYEFNVAGAERDDATEEMRKQQAELRKKQMAAFESHGSSTDSTLNRFKPPGKLSAKPLPQVRKRPPKPHSDAVARIASQRPFMQRPALPGKGPAAAFYGRGSKKATLNVKTKGVKRAKGGEPQRNEPWREELNAMKKAYGGIKTTLCKTVEYVETHTHLEDDEIEELLEFSGLPFKDEEDEEDEGILSLRDMMRFATPMSVDQLASLFGTDKIFASPSGYMHDHFSKEMSRMVDISLEQMEKGVHHHAALFNCVNITLNDHDPIIRIVATRWSDHMKGDEVPVDEGVQQVEAFLWEMFDMKCLYQVFDGASEPVLLMRKVEGEEEEEDEEDEESDDDDESDPRFRCSTSYINPQDSADDESESGRILMRNASFSKDIKIGIGMPLCKTFEDRQEFLRNAHTFGLMCINLDKKPCEMPYSLTPLFGTICRDAQPNQPAARTKIPFLCVDVPTLITRCFAKLFRLYFSPDEESLRSLPEGAHPGLPLLVQHEDRNAEGFKVVSTVPAMIGTRNGTLNGDLIPIAVRMAALSKAWLMSADSMWKSDVLKNRMNYDPITDVWSSEKDEKVNEENWHDLEIYGELCFAQGFTQTEICMWAGEVVNGSVIIDPCSKVDTVQGKSAKEFTAPDPVNAKELVNNWNERRKMVRVTKLQVVLQEARENAQHVDASAYVDPSFNEDTSTDFIEAFLNDTGMKDTTFIGLWKHFFTGMSLACASEQGEVILKQAEEEDVRTGGEMPYMTVEKINALHSALLSAAPDIENIWKEIVQPKLVEAPHEKYAYEVIMSFFQCALELCSFFLRADLAGTTGRSRTQWTLPAQGAFKGAYAGKRQPPICLESPLCMCDRVMIDGPYGTVATGALAFVITAAVAYLFAMPIGDDPQQLSKVVNNVAFAQNLMGTPDIDSTWKFPIVNYKNDEEYGNDVLPMAMSPSVAKHSDVALSLTTMAPSEEGEEEEGEEEENEEEESEEEQSEEEEGEEEQSEEEALEEVAIIEVWT